MAKFVPNLFLSHYNDLLAMVYEAGIFVALTCDEVLSPSNILVFNTAGAIECSVDAEWYTA